ncbi:MAG: cytochrome P450 [Alphaproteobacteria bacterium]
MSLYTPPMPPRPRRPLNPLIALMRARRNLLSVWHEGAFERSIMSVRLPSRKILVCNGVDVIKRILLDNYENYDSKSLQMRKALAPLLGDGLFVSDGEVWRRRRAMVTPAIAAAQLPNYAPMMVACAEETAKSWRELADGTTIDALSEMAVLTARIIGRTVFGDGISQAEAMRIVRGFSDYQAVIEQMDLLATLGGPAWLQLRPGRRARNAADEVQSMVDLILSRAGADGENMRLAAMLLSNAECLEDDPVAAVRNEAMVLFMAGHETTANALAWAWYLIAMRPDVEARLHQEVDTVLACRSATLEDFPRLPYARAIIEETLRLYPPVPILSREAKSADTLRGRSVRKGDIIIVAPWLVHRHKAYWRDPDAFIPERFLPESRENPPKFAYIPFSGGPRVCLGARFGLVEAVLILATLAKNFRLISAQDHHVEIECRLTLRPKGGLPMRLERRR